MNLQTLDELAHSGSGTVDWLWHGYLARGAVTLLTSRWKAGKTTLLSVLLAKLSAGGELAGEPVAAGRVAVVSEEAPGLWVERGQRLGYGPHFRWVCRPFVGPPTPAQWAELVALLAADRSDLVVIDPLAPVLPRSVENNASGLLATLGELYRLTDGGSAVLLLHHPRKGGPADELSPRGSGALPGFVDVEVKLDRVPGSAVGDRRRRLRAASRYRATPAERRLELNADATDYTTAADADAEDFAAGWPVLRMVLEDASAKLTRQAVLNEWPPDHPRPSPATLWRWLDRAVATGEVLRGGAGRRYDPYCYWLPGRERHFLPDLPPLPPLEWPGRGDDPLIRTADRAAEEFLAERARPNKGQK
jgi:hypothetical protein